MVYRTGSQPRNLSRFIASGDICLLSCTHFCCFFHLEWNHAYIEKQQVLLKCIAYTPMFYHHFEVFFSPTASNTITVKIKFYPCKVFLFLTTLLLFFYLEFQVVGHLMREQPEGH